MVAVAGCRRGHQTPKNRFGQCVECLREARRRYRLRGKAPLSVAQLKAKRTAYQNKLAGLCKRGHSTPRDQHGVCPECQKVQRYGTSASRPKPEFCELGCGRPAAVFDHDHLTGLFRGWLCSSCNVGLGMFRDEHVLLRRAAIYAERGGLASRRRRQRGPQ